MAMLSIFKLENILLTLYYAPAEIMIILLYKILEHNSI